MNGNVPHQGKASQEILDHGLVWIADLIQTPREQGRMSTQWTSLLKNLPNMERSLSQETIGLRAQENSLFPELNHEGLTPFQRDLRTCDPKSVQARSDSLRWARRSDHLMELGLCSR